MLKTLFAPLVVLLFVIVGPTTVLADNPQLDETHPIVGKWTMIKAEVDGEAEEIKEGMFVVEFTADGKITSYQEGDEIEKGTYKIDGDTITVFIGEDQAGEKSTFSIEGDQMIAKQEVAEGLIVAMTFKRIKE